MQVSKYIKIILKCAPFFVVMIIAIIFILMANDNSQTSQLTQNTGVPQPSGEKINSQVQIFSGDTNIYISDTRCVSHDVFTSLPAKCMTSDGKLIQVNKVSSEPIILPEGK
jgi:hypothetical protein